MMQQESSSGTDSVKIDSSALASIAFHAATEIDGVKQCAKNLKDYLYDIAGIKFHNGICVKFDKNNDVKIRVSLVIKYGYNIPEVASKVQENVYRALERMAGVNIKDIDIHIQSVEK